MESSEDVIDGDKHLTVDTVWTVGKCLLMRCFIACGSDRLLVCLSRASILNV